MEGKQMVKRNRSKIEYRLKVRLNMILKGECAGILLELKRRGIALSNTDAVVQALLALDEKILKKDLARARLRALEKAIEERGRE